jgi:hypothetical protein
MKNLKLKKELVYGGNNKQNPPFSVGDKLKQIYRFDDNGNIIKDGREMYEFVGMKGDRMLLKTLNIYAAHAKDIIDSEMLRKFVPIYKIGTKLQLHYKHADRYEVVESNLISK